MPTPTNTLIPEKYDYNQIAQRLSTLQPSEDIGTRMGKAFADSATGIVQNLVEVGADIHDTVVSEGYESMLNPLAKGIESVKQDIGYRSGIDFQGMQEGLRNDGLSGFWSKFKFEDIPELMAQSFPYMVGAYNAAGFAAISASMAKEMAKNTAVNEGRDPNQTTLSDTLTALPAGMAITALDSLIPNTMTANVMKSIVGRSATTAANRVADRGISTLIKDVATSVVTEGATESVQELIQFAQEHKGQGVLSPEALSQYGVAGLLGGMSGGTMNVAMKPVETISSIMPSKTTKPAIDSLEAGEIDTRQVDILNKKVNTDTFQSLPEEEKMNIIDNAVFDSPLEVIDNKAKVVLSDGSGMFEVDLTIADDATSFGKLIRSDGTEVELTGGYGQYLDMIYGSIYNKIQSFDTVESLNKFMEQSGLDKVDPTNNVVHTAVANKAAEIQSMLLNEKAKSQTKGSFGKGIDTSNLYGAMNDIHTNFMKEMTNKTEKELFASIGRLVFNPDTLQPRNRQASKKVQALKDLVTAEEQYMLYRYIQQYGNVNNSNTKKVAAFIEKQYGIKTTYYNKIGMFKFSSISEPVVEQPIIPAVSPSPKIEIQPTSTTTGSDMEIPSTTTSQITPEKYGQNGIVESNEKTDNKPEKRKQSAKTESIVEKSKPKEGVDNGLQEQKTTEEVVEEIPVEEVREQSKDFTGITPDGISARNTNRMVKAKNIATKLGMDLSTQVSNLQNELKQFRTSILGMLPSNEQLDRQAIHGKNFNKNFANDDYIKTLQIDNKSGLYYVTSLLGAINSIKSNQPLFISRYDEDTETYVEILSNEQVEQVNNFGGVRLEEVVNTIARTLTNEFNLRPTDKFDDNANNTINEQAYKGALLAIKSLVSTGKLEELSIQDKDKVIHRFYKLADDSVYDNVSIFAKELDSRDIKSPNFVLDVNSNENPNIVDKTQLRSNGVKVSKKTEKALRMLQKQSYKINLDMQDILLDDALMNDSEFINNIIHFDNPANHHPNFREQIESTNNAYKRTLDRLIDFVKLAKDEEEFWFKYQVNSNGRFQPYATVANPVSDKLFARWIVDNSHSNAMYEVTKNGTDKTTYQWKHSIVLAFSEAKLIDFKSPDKKDGKANLEAFDSIANSTTISDALKLLSQGKKSEAVKLVSKGGLHSIRAFLDYAKYVELSDNESFDTSMPTEVDGITNGLVMQLMQVFNGAKASTVPYLKMVGVYLKGGDVNSIYDYRNRGNDDIYTTVANQVIRYLENTPAKEFLSAIDAMSRSVAKSPVMVWLYNAGNYGIEMKVGSSVVENFMEVAYQDSLKEPKNRTITAEMLDGMHMFYIDEISKLEDNKIQVSKEQFKELLNKVVKGTKLSEKDILNLETAFGLSVGKQITNSMEQQFNGISNAKNIFSEVSQFINESFYKTYKTIGRKAYLEQITISGHKDTESGVSTYTNDKELNPDKRYGIYYNNNGKVSVVSTSPIEKVVQNPFNKEGKPRGQKRGFVVLTHNLDATVMADSVIDFIGKNKYFGFPIFDAFVGSASSMNDFMSTYNNNLYRINKDYSNLEALQQALISAKDLLSKYNLLTKVNQNKFNELDTLVAESINQNNAMRKDMYSDTGIDVNHINQMSGIQPYEEYEQSLSQGSSSDSITGTLTETRVLKKDTNDFVELFDEIKQLDEVPVEENHSKYLRDLVGYIQNRLGDYQKETKVDIYKDAVSNAGEYYAENIKLSIGNKVSSYAYQSMQEIYAHELVHKAVDKAFKTDAKTRNELNVIFNKFIDYVKSNNTTLPKATFDYILSVNDASEFASYAVTNKDVMNVLEQIPSTLPSKSTGKRKTMFEILSEAVKLMISKFMTVTRLENSSLKLLTAKNAREEVDIVIAEMMAVNKQFNSIKKDNIFNQTYKGIGKVNAPISSAIQATTRVIKTSPIGRAFHDSLVNRGMMYRLANNQFVRAFSNEIVRRPKEEEALLKLTKLAINTNSNYINQKRAISNAVNDALNNATTQDRIALKNILLDLDCVSVFNDAKEIGEYLNNKALRYQKIKDIQNSILSMAKTDKQKNYARFIINQAIGLGYNLATHDSILNQAQLLNADNITNFKLVNHSKNVENFAADKVTRELLTKQVDLLATLYGINNSKMSDVALAGKYIAANTSAIDNILEFQLAQVNRSKEQLFNLKGESHLYMKGYSATMLNPNDQYTVIEESKVAGMKKQGWKVLSDVVPTDIKYSSTQHKMVLMRRINVDPNYASGIISVQSPTSKGTTLNQIGLTLPKEDNKINVDSYISNVISDISTMPTGQMIPLLSPSGKTFEVANYRYMMTKNNKTALLGMINDISTVMAETYAMTERKIRENQDNYDLVKAINKDYAEHIDSGEFVKIDNDGEYKDYWRMLPKDTRNYITRHNGEGFIYVRKQLINELFGYTNATVSQALRLKEEHYVLELMEKIWKDMVGIIRNSIVIRTFKVVYDNMFSNFRSVMLFMPADKAFKYMKEAWVLTDQYRKDHDKLTEIEARIASGKPYDKALHSRLKKAVESNPVIELFQEGKFEAIVDDLNIEEHDKRNIVEQKIEQLFDKINSKAVRDAADLVYIGEDTALYKALSKATIYGDFIARYAIYRHLRESNVSKDEAITTIDDMFVKYSVLQNKWIKWTGDMGMFVFSSYFFRIQRGIYRAFRDKSAYVGSQYAIEKITGDTSDITDSFIGGANITARLGTGFRNINEVVEPHLLDNLGLI